MGRCSTFLVPRLYSVFCIWVRGLYSGVPLLLAGILGKCREYITSKLEDCTKKSLFVLDAGSFIMLRMVSIS